MTDTVYRNSHAATQQGTITNSHQYHCLSAARGIARVHLLAFAALAALLLGVVFVLPNMVTPPDPATVAIPKPEEIKTEAPQDSPWQDAQLAKQRREAQEVLAKILSIQTNLEQKKVTLWAKEAFERAMNTAAQGDIEYRERNFDVAQNHYRDSLKQFQALEQQIDNVYLEQLSKGQKGITDNVPRSAIDGYQLALYLKPDSEVAQMGLYRAERLEQVMQLVAQGDHQMKLQAYNKAEQAYQQALELDSQSQPAQTQLTKAKAAIKAQRFADSMSKGYKAIDQAQFEQAISAFAHALKIKPGAADAEQALMQAKNQALLADISNLNTLAQAMESQEQWQQAHAHYQKMLTLDSSLMAAKIGAIRSKARAELDSQLQNALTDPQRLTAPPVYQQAELALDEALKINDPGPRLLSQIEQLNHLLTKLQQPVSVRIQSDSQTNVTLYKVGELGIFDAKIMDLKPGKYTAVGTREGFRDVRQEFTLMPGTAQTTIVVQCKEKITNG